ncbi:BrnA antitoxin family protein [Granulicella sp. dw_53]|uniref:BrnA antitoxin family protein n=1 Tax=Granulicella sp. dw_53 TaxID=2719792 RepID=UPI00210706D7|nr:BrnA antitoxin family protein [Granulicella sp. dw_53]
MNASTKTKTVPKKGYAPADPARPHRVTYRREPGDPLTQAQKDNLEALSKMPDSEIDTSDIPEWTDGQWSRAERGKWYRPVKQAVSLRLDADVIAWLKKDGEGYQTRANQMLRERMLADLKGR